MAQPQGLNVPAIITTGIVTVVLVATVVEGVRAYYYYSENQEIERKSNGGTQLLAQTVKKEQTLAMERSSVTIDAAMKKLIESKGQLPTTQPAK